FEKRGDEDYQRCTCCDIGLHKRFGDLTGFVPLAKQAQVMCCWVVVKQAGFQVLDAGAVEKNLKRIQSSTRRHYPERTRETRVCVLPGYAVAIVQKCRHIL